MTAQSRAVEAADKSSNNEGLEGAAIEAAAKAMAVVTALDSHLREHGLMTEEHRREHDALLREVASAASQLDKQVRDTAQAFDTRIRDATTTLETRVREVAELHWDNHRIEHQTDQRAVDKVERNMVERFASVNEFRAQQKDIVNETVSRAEHNATVKAMMDRITALETYRAQTEGKDRGSAPYTAIAFSVITSIITAIAIGAVVVTTR